MFKKSKNETSTLWLIKLFSGIAIIFLLALHFIVNHLVAPEGLLSYEDVLKYYANPVIPIIEIIFLILVVSHGLIGFRSILLDLNLKTSWMRWINIALVFVGCLAIILGIWLVIMVASANYGT